MAVGLHHTRTVQPADQPLRTLVAGLVAEVETLVELVWAGLTGEPSLGR